MADLEPTHCYDCGAYLMGGATRHKPGCKILQLIEEALERCEDKSAPEAKET